MAPRRRKNPADNWMPPRVYRGKYAYEWHPAEGGSVRLCKLDAKPAEVLRAFDEARAGRAQENTFAWLVNAYFSHDRFNDLAAASQADYRQSSKKILPVFGKMRPSKITTPHIRRYMDARGKVSRHRANRELSFLHVVFRLGREMGVVGDVLPSHGVKPFSEQRRTHYVTDEAYQAVYAVAPPQVQVAMEIAYCAGLRRADVLKLRWSDVTDAGLLVTQQKTEKRMDQALEKELSPRLDKALQAARHLPRPEGLAPVWIVHNSKGQQYTGTGFASVWSRAVKRAGQSFTFHDLRRKAITDYEGNQRRQFSGHKSEQMAQRYNVKPIKSPSH